MNSRNDMIFFFSFPDSNANSDSYFGFGMWCAVAVAVLITLFIIVKGIQYRKKNTRGQLNLAEFDIINNEAH